MMCTPECNVCIVLAVTGLSFKQKSKVWSELWAGLSQEEKQKFDCGNEEVKLTKMQVNREIGRHIHVIERSVSWNETNY